MHPDRRPRRFFVTLSCLLTVLFQHASAQEAIRVGVLYSGTGTMAVSESVLRDAVLMLIDEQNARGGLLGRPLEPVVLDPRSNWGLYGQQARRMLEREKVAAIFGCWTSASRKAVLPVLEDLNGLLFYAVQYEGQEASKHVIYTGATPNQQALPAVDYLRESRKIERWILAGTDYVYPRTANRILAAYLTALGVDKGDILINYSPFGFRDWEGAIARFRRFAASGKRTAIISTINGDANIAFYEELRAQGVSPADLPVMAFSVSEQELASIDTEGLQGHLVTWGYLMSTASQANREFVARWRRYRGDGNAVTNDPMEAIMIGFRLWVRAVDATGSLAPDVVRGAIVGMREVNLMGMEVSVSKSNHIDKPAVIAEITAEGGLRAVWQTKQAIAAQPWSPYIPRYDHGPD